jgi:hypothetical protein
MERSHRKQNKKKICEFQFLANKISNDEIKKKTTQVYPN